MSGIFSFLLGWNDVLFASVITRPESQTAAVALQIFATGTEGGAIPYYGQMMAAALVCAAPVVLLYLFLQKDLISGRYDRRRSEVTMTETVQWSLSGFADEIDADPRVQAAVMRALGASHIEVRGVWDTPSTSKERPPRKRGTQSSSG